MNARFAICTGVECAQPTPKTLSTEPVSISSVDSRSAPAPARGTVASERDIELPLPNPSTSAAAPVSGHGAQPAAPADQWTVTLPIPARPGDMPSGPRAHVTTTLAAADRRDLMVDERPPAPAEANAGAPSTSPAPPLSDPAESRIVINFAFAGFKLTAEAQTAIRDALPRVRSAERVVIAGRTDSVGDTSANQAIALARAMSVRDYISKVAPDIAGAIAIDARGNCCFVASNTTQDGRAKNRRVEIVMRGRVDA